MTVQPEKVTVFQRTVRFVLAGAVFLCGVMIAVYLVKTKPKSKKVPRENLGELVEVSAVARGPRRVDVEANGQVIPSQVVALSAEVGGRVVWMDEKLVPGSRVEARRKLLSLQRELARAQAQLAFTPLSEGGAP